jgi:hypothetical protein
MIASFLPAAALGAGRLLGPAFACGLNLYATVAVLGLASRLGWSDALPAGLRGLEHGVVIGSALALYLVEFVIDKIRWADSAWDAVHTVIRPGAAALLAMLALQGAPLGWRLAAAALAGAAALGAHGLKAGLRVSLNVRAGRGRAIVVSLLEDLLAIALVLASLMLADLAVAIAAAATLMMLLLGPRLSRPAVLGVRAVNARLRGFFGSCRWRGRDELPASLRRLVPPAHVGCAPPRATRAAVLDGADSGTGDYRNGWLVLENGAAAFLYRDSLLRGRRAALPAIRAAILRRGLLADRLEITGEHRSLTLLLLKDGPPPHITRTELLS